MEDRRETNRSTPQRVENSGQESVERVQWLSLLSFPYTSSIPFTCVACRLERDDQTQWHERYRFADENRPIISKLMFLDLCFLKYFFILISIFHVILSSLTKSLRNILYTVKPLDLQFENPSKWISW